MRNVRINLYPRGFTLLELLVVGTIGTMLILFLANATRWYARSMQATQISIRLTRELKFAAEAIARDFGPGIAARTVDGSTLQIDTDMSDPDGIAQWAAPDEVVEYAIESDRLVRRNLTSGDTIPLADHITDLDVEVVDGRLQAHLTAAIRNTEQALTLQLEE